MANALAPGMAAMRLDPISDVDVGISFLKKNRMLNYADEPFLRKIKYYLTIGRIAIIGAYDDEYFSLGFNHNGVLGVGHARNEFLLTPQRLDNLCGKGITGISGGGNNLQKTFFFAWKPFELYSWGYNANGELGQGTTTKLHVPTLVTATSTCNIVDVACGYNHAIALLNDGTVFAWGHNSQGQLGNGAIYPNNPNPTKVNGLPANVKVIAVNCGQYFSAALTEAGEIFVWGKNDHGQLGLGHLDKTPQPTKVDVEDECDVRFTKVACGPDFMLALAGNGQLYGWGGNKNGELGVDDKATRLSPILVATDLNFVDIAASIYSPTSFAKTLDNKFYIWGLTYYFHNVLEPMEISANILPDLFLQCEEPVTAKMLDLSIF